MHASYILLPLAFGVSADGFLLTTPSQTVAKTHVASSASSLPMGGNEGKPSSSSSSSSSPASTPTASPPPKNGAAVVMSQALPFLRCPTPLVDCTYAGNVGFDPLGLSKNEDQLAEYREAEIKHARLAMLAAAGWPLSELFDRQIAAFLGLTPVLDMTDRAPSILNGGLDQVSPAWWGFCVGLTAAIDLYGVAKSRESRPSYFPGNLGFDPLGLYPKEEDTEGRKRVELAEIKHGRLAMLAVLGYAVEEFVTKVGVVDETPFFFQPILLHLQSLFQP